MADYTDDNVTLALLKQELRHTTQQIQGVREAMRDDTASIRLALKDELLLMKLALKEEIGQVNFELRQLNNMVRQHETRITVLERFSDEQVRPIIVLANENRLELARVVAKYGSIGVGGGGGIGLVVWLIGKSQGAW